MKLDGKLFDKGGLTSAMGQAERVRRSLELCIELVNIDPTGRAAFALLACAVKENHGAQATMASMVRSAVFDDYRDAAAEFTEQHSGEDLDQIERDLRIAGRQSWARAEAAFLRHLRIVVELATENLLSEDHVADSPGLAVMAADQQHAVAFLTEYLEGHRDESV